MIGCLRDHKGGVRRRVSSFHLALREMSSAHVEIIVEVDQAQLEVIDAKQLVLAAGGLEKIPELGVPDCQRGPDDRRLRSDEVVFPGNTKEGSEAG